MVYFYEQTIHHKVLGLFCVRIKLPSVLIQYNRFSFFLFNLFQPPLVPCPVGGYSGLLIGTIGGSPLSVVSIVPGSPPKTTHSRTRTMDTNTETFSPHKSWNNSPLEEYITVGSRIDLETPG